MENSFVVELAGLEESQLQLISENFDQIEMSEDGSAFITSGIRRPNNEIPSDEMELPRLTPIIKLRQSMQNNMKKGQVEETIDSDDDDNMEVEYLDQDEEYIHQTQAEEEIVKPEIVIKLPVKKRITHAKLPVKQVAAKVEPVSYLACQICGISTTNQEAFFAHLKSHYEPPAETTPREVYRCPSNESIEIKKERLPRIKQVGPKKEPNEEIKKIISPVKDEQEITIQFSSDDEDEIIMAGIREAVDKVEVNSTQWFGDDNSNWSDTEGKRLLDEKLKFKEKEIKKKVRKEKKVQKPPKEKKEKKLKETNENKKKKEKRKPKEKTTPAKEDIKLELIEEEIKIENEEREEKEEREEQLVENPTNVEIKYYVEVLDENVGEIDELKIAGGKSKKKRIQCNQCDKNFNSKNALQYHLLHHTGIRPHQCDVCGKGFFAGSALKVHMRLHSGVKPYTCEFCSRPFRQWGDMKYHIASLHTEKKMFQCEYCGKDFARRYSLVIHRRIHTGERNYACEFCDKTFRASSYLQNHRMIHTGEKRHECHICHKKFRVRSDMKRHINTHLREKNPATLQPKRTIAVAATATKNLEATMKTPEATEMTTIIVKNEDDETPRYFISEEDTHSEPEEITDGLTLIQPKFEPISEMEHKEYMVEEIDDETETMQDDQMQTTRVERVVYVQSGDHQFKIEPATKPIKLAMG